jgi:ATPase family AAA domain-containing protein 2
MSHRPKRRLDDFEIANASDPEDGDWEAGGSPKPQRRSKTRHSKGSRPKKRIRRGYQNSDDDIVDDEDDVSEESFLDASEIESEEEVELNPRTGRPSRSATKKEIKYEESEDEIEDTGDSDGQSDENITRTRRGKAEKPSLIIKLPVAAIETTTRPRSSKREPTPGAHGIRRSSRLSHDPEETLLELTNSGRHTQVARAGTQTPEPEVGRGRATRGSKGLVGGKRPPSAIMEASQEGSGPSRDMDEEEQGEDAEAEDTLLVIPKTEVQASENASEAGFEMQDAQQEPTDTQGEEGVIAESVHEDEIPEDDDSDEGPITRGGRNLRVSGLCSPS